jgi:hypothetical protein
MVQTQGADNEDWENEQFTRIADAFWLVREGEGDSYIKEGHHYMNHMSLCRLPSIVLRFPS